ncbi:MULTISPECIES: ATP-dependent metallopeptidase FtsH/Yme1/Tma family protein [unclassified Rhizobium]|uniref:ATP-dependent Zn protease n=1 Tax=unclassified Rhizobium TaxID=2613769 RepID=UPI001ADA896E|nr:ATP-dependent Zn protease [Rhizobium sp. 16-488-2b]MBO9178194.1 ATP-dependent Zn protease [Rhizobium sp. 16-488-2a]
MKRPTEAVSLSNGAALLRRLATRALGLTGADIERAVREARSKARRQGRGLTYDDVEAGIRGHRPPLNRNTRWRYAVHEAGHAVVHHGLRLGSIRGLTIDSQAGGFNMVGYNNRRGDVLEHYDCLLAMLMAGRAAEVLVLGDASAGSGGADESDLARATRIALDMETTLGFGTDPLVYRHHADATSALSGDAALRQAIQRRLQVAFGFATETLMQNRAALDRLSRALFALQAMDGKAVTAILEGSG